MASPSDEVGMDIADMRLNPPARSIPALRIDPTLDSTTSIHEVVRNPWGRVTGWTEIVPSPVVKAQSDVSMTRNQMQAGNNMRVTEHLRFQIEFVTVPRSHVERRLNDLVHNRSNSVVETASLWASGALDNVSRVYNSLSGVICFPHPEDANSLTPETGIFPHDAESQPDQTVDDEHQTDTHLTIRWPFYRAPRQRSVSPALSSVIIHDFGDDHEFGDEPTTLTPATFEELNNIRHSTVEQRDLADSVLGFYTPLSSSEVTWPSPAATVRSSLPDAPRVNNDAR
ncbi:hypothetical protein TREMEDRAFT_66050 [Tremella mesenterica DSM 1558]|uniref:uncharacterized protein n=1 Tax=Tremella mesenterica (strain ATCC 24925 / CBS 8224 / DSM 1558 / NBRC 9311 / NRRL Y-6157 / RJB 2259-6 / UBC 559-6) TaxID=578456 RepID=UPI00032B9511|nr:uncharacterized protein TREMEDRAFT_66050 [Tremella mesenterica DSM 1558]EIW65960.1 hypothetical protein TREMEDRAFT_66050 [Tremella mesenterica DSM 1558]